ncbi:hypothetical protein ASPWEDRAFT_33430 [Aspergillus wentii DTO 134E9]|uniref:Prion-inhibition and propagation HeLo domain-containing protein n=1 Tax=Aspergillus wentii DTO 134E9 TaxID=1073089 RepID=A0A1L9RYQ0_ASPWE|nr:uncharacterized protein ASPWEDRAFT_33430 [Aspergillus wentii DTO 134E9]KAI9932531.1 hypothetical protein MW887_008773 [Aspergillus wentii]OJJ40096.1 hypothetical protein ASPWEDRAFT_33430 [Aspergillus wentii DTO 134E9]
MANVETALSLFQFSIETLGRIQLAREFQDDFDTHQLKLDIIQLRLSRWGELAGISTVDNAQKNANESQHQATLTAVKTILGEIQDCLVKARREAEKLRKKLDLHGAEALDPESCLPIDLKKIRTRFMESLRKRKVQAVKVGESIKWVFYKKEHFDKFVANISELLDGLEKTIPEEDREKLRQLSDEECKGISKSNMEELKDIVEGCDPWLESSVDEKLASGAGTVINQSHNTGSTVGIHHGDNKGVSYGANSTQTNTFS